MSIAASPEPSAEAVRNALTLLPSRPVVCVQGLGFVGAATAAAIADARDGDGDRIFNVVGVDRATLEGRAKIAAINAGQVPIATTDSRLIDAAADASAEGNLIATADPEIFAVANVVIVSVPLDVVWDNGGPTVRLEAFRAAVREIGRWIPPGGLVIVQTTVPPGTTEKVVAPELASALAERGLSEDVVHIAHSYERVMPGESYYDSIVNFWRIYAGMTPDAADACEAFLSQVVNVAAYPLTRLHSTTASEIGKLLENSYRATTIALMEEWGRLAETIGVDLFEVINAIRMRPTHANMRQPGFGVGGYCLTKDPLLGQVGAAELYGLDLDFPFSSLAITVNKRMPLVALERLSTLLGGSLRGRKILLLGVSYRTGVGDTRHSPSELFVRGAHESGALVTCHDPLVTEWPELGVGVLRELPSPDGIDGVVFAVPHPEYTALDVGKWLGSARPAILDANNVLRREQRAELRALGCLVESVGRGDGL